MLILEIPLNVKGNAKYPIIGNAGGSRAHM